MGLQLTTPRVTGDFDTVDYRDIRIQTVIWSLMADEVQVHYQLGNFNDGTGEFTPGFEQIQAFFVRDTPDGDQDYTTFFSEVFKEGLDTNAERFIEMLTNLLSLRLGLLGVTVKPGRSGKKVI